MPWFELKISVSADTSDAVSNRLFELGAEGVTEADVTTLLGYFPAELKDAAVADLKSYWPTLKAIFPALPALKLEVQPVKEENWVERYKEFYYAQKLSELFFLRPIWDKKTPIPNGMIPIFMEPGQAFGTGLHPSTRLCLRLLETKLIASATRESTECLDVGTGTGILAFVAYKLGVKKVCGVDNDPIAVEVARENAAFNNATEIEFTDKNLNFYKKPFDFVISNILLETHRELATEYTRLVKMGGLLLLSGLLGYQKKELMEIITPQGFTLLESRNSQEWAAYLFVRRELK